VVSEVTRESAFTITTNGAADVSDKPRWAPVLVQSVFSSVHGRYAFALGELKRYAIVCEQERIDVDRRVALGRQLLMLLQEERFEEAERLIDNAAKGDKTDDPKH
jgi:hypothetical protein